MNEKKSNKKLIIGTVVGVIISIFFAVLNFKLLSEKKREREESSIAKLAIEQSTPEVSNHESKVKEEVEEEKSQLDENEGSKYPRIGNENIVAKSDKDFSDLSKSKPSYVNQDVTGNWRISMVSTSENILEYVLSYYRNNFNSNEEIHAIVNLLEGTTLRVYKLYANVIAVAVHEYVDGEEGSAKKLFEGSIKDEYWIYTDNGDVELIS